MTNNVQTCCYNGGRKLRCEPQWRARKMDLEKWFLAVMCRLCCRPKEYLVFSVSLLQERREVTSLRVDIYHSPPFQECRLGLQEHTCEIKALEDLTFSPSLCVCSSVRTLPQRARRSSAYKNDCGEETQFGWRHLLYLQGTKDERPIKNLGRRLMGYIHEKTGSRGFKQETERL